MPQASSKSFWIRDAGTYEPSPSLDGSLECDVVVVGGGTAGMSSAWHLKKDDSSLSVALLEAEIIGWGSSGRNAGWLIPDFGPDQQVLRRKYGAERAREMVMYGRRAFEYACDMINDNRMQSEYRRPGRLKVAFDAHWVDGLQKTLRLDQDIGMKSRWMDRDEVRAEFSGNTNFHGAIFEPDVAIIHPCRHVREMKRLAVSAGVMVFEETPAIHLSERSGGVEVVTPRGTIRAKKLVITTNAYTNLLKGPVGSALKRDQAPTIARAAVTEILTDSQWKRVGWERRCALMSSLPLMHLMTPLTDGRILFNYGYHSGHPRSGEMEPVLSAEAAFDSFEHLCRIFPVLREVRIAQMWGGHMSTTFDRLPHLGVFPSKRVIYLTGCWGHGQAVNHLHGQTISHLVRDIRSELTDCWFINHPKSRWPISPIDHWGKLAVWEGMRRNNRRLMKGSIFD